MIKHVKATGLSSVFQGLDPVTFTDEAKNKGVTNNSIIYIKCTEGDEKYGEQFVPGSTWIWAQGEWFASYSRPITEEEILEIVTDDFSTDAITAYDELMAEQLKKVIGE